MLGWTLNEFLSQFKQLKFQLSSTLNLERRPPNLSRSSLSDPTRHENGVRPSSKSPPNQQQL